MPEPWLTATRASVAADVDWREVARLVLTSREMDRLEEEELVPAKKVLYQFSARGHDMAQVLLGLQLKDGDAACGYYRSRPLLLALGVPLADALGSGMGLAGGYSDGRDIGVVFNYPNPGGAHALPMCGGVGAQYTPAAGWAQAIAYKTEVLERGAGRRDRGGARRRRELRDRRILVGANHCHDATVADAHLRRGQWLRHLGPVGLPDAGQGHRRQPRQLRRPDHLQRRRHRSGRGGAAGQRGGRAMSATKRAPALLRLTVPRLEGHSFQDTQSYKSEAEIAAEWARDPLPKLQGALRAAADRRGAMGPARARGRRQVEAARAEAEARGVSSPERVTDHVFFEGEMQQVGGRRRAQPRRHDRRAASPTASGSTWSPRSAATLDQELDANPRVLLFGEDVGPKGGVHAVTLGLQDKFGRARVFDTVAQRGRASSAARSAWRWPG